MSRRRMKIYSIGHIDHDKICYLITENRRKILEKIVKELYQIILLEHQKLVEKNTQLKKEHILQNSFLRVTNIRKFFLTKFLKIEKDISCQKHYRKEETDFKGYNFKGNLLENYCSLRI